MQEPKGERERLAKKRREYLIDGLIVGGLEELMFGPNSNLHNLETTAYIYIGYPIIRYLIKGGPFRESTEANNELALGLLLGQTTMRSAMLIGEYLF